MASSGDAELPLSRFQPPHPAEVLCANEAKPIRRKPRVLVATDGASPDADAVVGKAPHLERPTRRGELRDAFVGIRRVPRVHEQRDGPGRHRQDFFDSVLERVVAERRRRRQRPDVHPVTVLAFLRGRHGDRAVIGEREHVLEGQRADRLRVTRPGAHAPRVRQRVDDFAAERDCGDRVRICPVLPDVRLPAGRARRARAGRDRQHGDCDRDAAAAPHFAPTLSLAFAAAFSSNDAVTPPDDLPPTRPMNAMRT